MKRCEGDCQADSDCAGSLVCHRRVGTADVPGCYGDGESDVDYCVKVPSDQHALEDTGDGKGENGYVECQGDCDDDTDCTGSLKCFQRDNYEAVPYCSGMGTKGWDYCFAAHSPKLDSGSNPRRRNTKLMMCQGDCDDDSQCVSPSICFQRNGYTKVPGCSASGTSGWDYCVYPYLKFVKADPPFPEKDTIYQKENAAGILKKCQGDCDSDSQCQGPHLVCVQRDSHEPVPGCMAGVGASERTAGYDYCADVNAEGWPKDAVAGVGGALTRKSNDVHRRRRIKLGLCEGHCDSNSDCAGFGAGISRGATAFCFSRSGYEQVPGCKGTGDTSMKYCVPVKFYRHR